MCLARKLGVFFSALYIALMVHETATGLGYVQDVAYKLVMHYDISHQTSIIGGFMIVAVTPLIACAGLLAFKKKE